MENPILTPELEQNKIAIFEYNGKKTKIQCNKEDKLFDIIKRYKEKANLDVKSVYFLHNGNEITDLENVELNENYSELFKENNSINLLVVDLIKSKYIICPTCKEHIRFEIIDYKINLHDCINKHKIDKILLDEFEDTQNIYMSKIICDKCKVRNKGNVQNNEFYKCNSCNYNICPSCKGEHDKNHNIINYDEKDFICKKHNINYQAYCKECNINLCLNCQNEHKTHKKKNFFDIIPNIDKIKKKWKN